MKFECITDSTDSAGAIFDVASEALPPPGPLSCSLAGQAAFKEVLSMVCTMEKKRDNGFGNKARGRR